LTLTFHSSSQYFIATEGMAMKSYLVTTIAVLLMLSPRWAAAQARPQVLTPQIFTFASSNPSVSLSTSGGVTFPAGNPSTQTVTPASTTLVATVSITSPKSGNTWSLAIRGAG